jgi:hypothetical protein
MNNDGTLTQFYGFLVGTSWHFMNK